MWDSFRLGATTSLWNQAGANLQSNLASVSHFCLSCVLLAPSPESIPTNKLLEQEFLSLLTLIYLAALGLSWAAWDLSLQCTDSSYIVPFVSFACMLSRSNSSRPHRLSSTRPLCPYDFLGKNTGVGFHFLCQRIVSTQGLNLQFSCVSCIEQADSWPTVLPGKHFLWGVWEDLSPQTMGLTHIPCTGTWVLNHWTTREVSGTRIPTSGSAPVKPNPRYPMFTQGIKLVHEKIQLFLGLSWLLNLQTQLISKTSHKRRTVVGGSSFP